ncbi:ferrous iron transport protein A [Leptospira ognonensis]|uniref:Ferrous iron transport protein A n=1 Tax=Leptospira ognonensis TaxID=2484945 RepID=A0A4R9JQZ6_9LEPT|nr:FeoA family protein [Leptospira ognonensis]TGL54904.1 ferrous iron transport protein A [Leptospira ognonensis]
MISLAELSEKEKGKVLTFDRSFISASQITELLELGFYPGAEIKCLETSPLLDKMIFSIGGIKVGLRIKDCQHIMVQTN